MLIDISNSEKKKQKNYPIDKRSKSNRSVITNIKKSFQYFSTISTFWENTKLNEVKKDS